MTKEEWKKVEDALAGCFGFVEMIVDGHEVRFEKKQIGKNRLGIMTYVDGWYRGRWTEDDPEIKYLRKVVKAVWKPKEIEKMKKIYGKRQWKQVESKYDEKITYCDPFWFSVSAIRRHYEKNFTSIELVEVNGVAVEKDGQILTNTMPAIG